ncbi:MAG: hypothetical protein GF383_10330 [Candidatus Lokiarchaeota archaeon]|nr:hypothetical protein [Candidatus Lokiarchaeota archaeon]MBD3340953.1 hypothetical protein [Candidatus Lokiarchaeota archaeon]
MSDKYVEYEVSKKTAKTARALIFSCVGIALLLFVVAGVLYAGGDYYVSLGLLIVAIFILFGGLIGYAAIAMGANMRRTMSRKRISKKLLRVVVMVVGSLLLLVFLVFILA